MARKPANAGTLPDTPPGGDQPQGGDNAPTGGPEGGGNIPDEPAKPKETKAEAFARLAGSRVSNVLYHVANVGKLSGPSYESTPEQRGKVFSAIRKAVDDAEARFQPKPAAGKPTFTL